MIIPAVVMSVDWVHAYCAWLNWVHIGYWSRVCLGDYIVGKNDCLGANGKVFERRVQVRWISVVVHCKKKWNHKEVSARCEMEEKSEDILKDTTLGRHRDECVGEVRGRNGKKNT